MKNSDLIEPSECNIERNNLLLFLFFGACVALDYLVYYLFIQFSPLVFLLMVPAALGSFQALWFLLNPFALVYKDRIEFKPSLFGGKKIYYNDIKRLGENKRGNLFIVYKDDEAEPLRLFGIRKTHISLLKDEIEKRIRVNP